MDAERWQRLQDLFAAALALPPAGRADFVAKVAADDPALASELTRLLSSDADAGADTVPVLLSQAARQLVQAEPGTLEGRMLGPWRLVSHLADGGMGAVYRAERADGQYEQQAAVKLLRTDRVSADARERLAQERQILARLQHPNIARLLDGSTTPEGQPYLVMAYVDGEPIDAWCHVRGLSTEARLRLFLPVCEAVDHAHRNLVVHRDLKPSNILVDREGRPQLLDFGIAKLQALGDEGLTRSGERLLTPSHASPEQVTGGAISTATDIYALGVLLYDLLVGQRPHEATSGNAAALARAIVEHDPARPSQALAEAATSSRRLARLRQRGEQITADHLARELRGDLDTIVLTALRKEPERRYASARELAEDIERHLSHRPVRARPDTLAYRSAKLLRRHPVAVPASALALLLAVAGTTAFTWRLADERDRAQAAERQAQAAAEQARLAARFSASTLANAGADKRAARQVSVLDLLRDARARVEEELDDEPVVAMHMRLALGRALLSWGVYDEAEREARAALEAAEAGRGPDAARAAAEALSLLGTVTHDQGHLQTSLDWTQQAERRWRELGTAAEKASALSDLALALNGLRRRAEAEPVFRAALAQMRLAHAGDHEDIAWLLNNLAWGLHAMGRLDEAAPVYDEALAMQRRLGTPVVTRSQTQANMAGLAADRGDLDAAERGFREVLAQYEAVYGTRGHAAVARMLNLVGRVVLIRGDVEQALTLTAEALATNRQVVGARHRWTSVSLKTHGDALLAAGRLNEAARHLREADAVMVQVLGAGHGDRAGVMLSQARLALRRGRTADAVALLQRARALIEALASPDRVPHGQVLLLLGHATALQDRRDEGLALAREGLQRLRDRHPPTHWDVQAAEAGLGLPPLVAAADPQALAAARQARDRLAQRLGARAPVVQALEGQLAQAGQPVR